MYVLVPVPLPTVTVVCAKAGKAHNITNINATMLKARFAVTLRFTPFFCSDIRKSCSRNTFPKLALFRVRFNTSLSPGEEPDPSFAWPVLACSKLEKDV